MQGSIERPLKVLTPPFAERLRVFNAAARTLQRWEGCRECPEPMPIATAIPSARPCRGC